MGTAVRDPDAARLLGQPAVAAVAAALEELLASGTVHVLPPGLRTPEELAAHLGVVPAALAACVLLVPPGPPPRTTRLRPRAAAGPEEGAVLVVTSRAHRVVPELVADALGLPCLEEAGAGDVLAGTASVLRGVAPLGHPAPLLTLVDVALAAHEVVWVPAGHPRTAFPTRYEELLRLTGGQPVEVG